MYEFWEILFFSLKRSNIKKIVLASRSSWQSYSISCWRPSESSQLPRLTIWICGVHTGYFSITSWHRYHLCQRIPPGHNSMELITTSLSLYGKYLLPSLAHHNFPVLYFRSPLATFQFLMALVCAATPNLGHLITVRWTVKLVAIKLYRINLFSK